jgi:hypothetical protein
VSDGIPVGGVKTCLTSLATLGLVRRMVEAGTARCVMGNHEFNAIAWATSDPEHPDWFKTLPLWLDLGGIRVVHASTLTDELVLFNLYP